MHGAGTRARGGALSPTRGRSLVLAPEAVARRYVVPVALSEHRIPGDVDQFIAHLDRHITGSSVTAQLEARSDRTIGDARMVVQVYERYSATGGNRLSLVISVLAAGGQMEVCAIASGGSTGMFWKLNTFGEQAFLQKAVDAIVAFAPVG